MLKSIQQQETPEKIDYCMYLGQGYRTRRLYSLDPIWGEEGKMEGKLRFERKVKD